MVRAASGGITKVLIRAEASMSAGQGDYELVGAVAAKEDADTMKNTVAMPLSDGLVAFAELKVVVVNGTNAADCTVIPADAVMKIVQEGRCVTGMKWEEGGEQRERLFEGVRRRRRRPSFSPSSRRRSSAGTVGRGSWIAC